MTIYMHTFTPRPPPFLCCYWELQDDDGTVTPEEYIIFNLKKMGKVDDETLALLRDQFLALDADGSGELDADDIRMLTEACSI